MPIDPRIALGVRPGPAPIMPSELEQRRLTLADLGRRETLDNQQAQLNDMRISEGQQQQAERRATLERAGKVRSILKKHGGDPEKALPELWSIDPAAADRFDTHLYERKKRGFEMKKSELEQAGARAKRLGEIAGTATDQATFQRAIGMAVAEKLLTPEIAAQLGDTWDDNTKAAVAQFRNQALDVAKQSDEARKAEEQGWKKAEAERKAAAEKRAQQLHDASLPAKTADPKTGMTPAQAAAVEGRKAAQGETARHHRAIEAKGEGSGDTSGKEAKSAISKLDVQAKGLQGKIDSLESRKGKHRQDKARYEAEIKSLGETKPDKWKEKQQAARSKWEGNETALREIESQQQDLVSRKEDLYGQIRGIKGGGGSAPAAAPAARRRAQNPQTGETVEWDGKQWVKVN